MLQAFTISANGDLVIPCGQFDKPSVLIFHVKANSSCDGTLTVKKRIWVPSERTAQNAVGTYYLKLADGTKATAAISGTTLDATFAVDVSGCDRVTLTGASFTTGSFTIEANQVLGIGLGNLAGV